MAPFDHPDWNFLLAGVTAAPDDDLPRLVAADWLEEHEEYERAEFIRIQCHLAGGHETDARNLSELRLREHALLVSPTGGLLWAWESCPHIVKFQFTAASSTLRGLQLSGSDRVVFHRGFPDRLSCDAEDWLHHGDGIVPRQPLRELTLNRCDQLSFETWWKMLATLGCLQRLTIDEHRGHLAAWLADRLPEVSVRRAQR